MEYSEDVSAVFPLLRPDLYFKVEFVNLRADLQHPRIQDYSTQDRVDKRRRRRRKKKGRRGGGRKKRKMSRALVATRALKQFSDKLIELPYNLQWLDPKERRNLIPLLSHTVSGGGEAIFQLLTLMS